MTIRKTGAADGRITQADELGAAEDGFSVTAAPVFPGVPWNKQDEDGLAEENEAAGLE
jgi:hypothetical protein